MLPKQVREAEERANAIHREVYGNTEAPAPAPAAPDATVVEAVATELPAPQTQTTEVAPAPVAQPDPWEEKYRVLEGKYKAEVPRLAQDVRELRTANERLQTQVEQLMSAPAPAPAPAELEGMTPEQVVEQFGEDFAKAVGAVAARVAKQNADALRQEFAPKLENVEKRSSQSARDVFIARLSEMVPTFAEIDADPEFTAFLDVVDPMTGRARRHFFNEADAANDAARIAQFFKTFKGNSTAPAAPAPAPAGPTAVEYALQPSSARASEAPPGKRMWTSADVRKFYADVRKGLHTPADARRIESDIFAAQRENRMAA